eukprot:4401830-Prymnesium_polylepis.1
MRTHTSPRVCPRTVRMLGNHVASTGAATFRVLHQAMVGVALFVGFAAAIAPAKGALQFGASTPARSRHATPRCATNSATNPAELFGKLLSPNTIRESIELQQELVTIATKQDPQVVLRRSLDLARALNTVSNEVVPKFLQAPTQPPPPQVVLRRLCEELGATYIKLGQFIASSPTLFPPEYVQEFQQCLDAAPPMPWETVKGIIESELGRPVEAVFSKVAQTPLAAASIAQVHAATLQSGEEVVIKVQKEGVQGSLQVLRTQPPSFRVPSPSLLQPRHATHACLLYTSPSPRDAHES